MPQDRRVVAIVATAATTLVVIGILFLFFYKLAIMVRRRRRNLDSSSHKEETVTSQEEFRQQGGTLKGIIVDENGLDIHYWRKLEQGELTMSKVRINPMEEEKRIDTRGNKQKNSKKIQETELFHEPEGNTTDLAEVTKPIPHFPSHKVTKLKPLWSSPPRLWSSPPRLWSSPPPIGPMRLRPSQVSPSPPPPPPPPPPPLPMKKIQSPPPPPPPPPPMKKIQSPPPPPPNLAMINTNVAPPPPPPEAGCLVTSPKPPPASRGKTNINNSRREAHMGESTKGFDEVKMKLKPLHWDKVTAKADHSVVWDEINGGSFRFDDDLMEALFGCTATSVKSPERIKISSSNSSNSGPTAKIFILDPRKSQNTAIVLRSLATSRKEILDALHEGQGLNSDILEKLMKISPTQEEASKILQFDSNPTKLADAESFLYQILKAIPSAFIRFDAMLFRSNYDSEILHLKESLQTIELGCKELRTRGVFFKLLEAILKAGNRMNAGTSRGNAQGFNLTTLRKLSFVKTTDGKSTLLHFIVEQVVRSEGERCVINRNHSLGRRGIQSNNNTDPNSESLTVKEERDKEYLMLGLPVLEGLSVDFTNVKKAATIDYNSFVTMSSNLAVRVPEIRQLVMSCGNGESGGFLREMKGFLEECEEELKVVKEEQTRIMELVKRTTTYYQAGASKDIEAHPLQLFVILKDFLDMVDQVCLDITRKLHKKNVMSVKSSPPPPPPPPPPSVRFQNFHTYFMSDKPETSSSESEDDF